MRQRPFAPTNEQERVLAHDGSAFVAACPGAGKTRVLVERARTLLSGKTNGKGIAFLSFTNAAVSEFQQRLRREGVLPSPPFPHFIDTFDAFVWQLLMAPFGVPGFNGRPRLIRDKDAQMIRPAGTLRELPLECFDRQTGAVVLEKAKRAGFDPNDNPGRARAYATAAATARDRFLRRGEVDFADARMIAIERLKDRDLSARLSRALAGRFCEVIVDEAQDCNPGDLDIIRWLRNAGIATKVICDPNQSIYEFRGGVTEELMAFSQTFDETDRLSMSGNFRSSDPICRAVVALRPKRLGNQPDRALGENADVTTPVHVLAYPGSGVPAAVGERYRDLVEAQGLDVARCPVLAATRHSGASAVGQPTARITKDLTLRLANAVTHFYFGFGNRSVHLEEIHRVVLEIEGRAPLETYHQYLAAQGIEPNDWRPMALTLVRELRYGTELCPDADAWLARARVLLERHLPTGQSISMRLRRNQDLSAALATPPEGAPSARTIHAVKGMEFPAVCVVMTTKKTSSILDCLESGSSSGSEEEARRLYVAASRAERLLVIAIPKSQAERLVRLFASTGTPVVKVVI